MRISLNHQLVKAQRKLGVDREIVETLAKISKLKEFKGADKSKGGGAGLKNTWKRIKGKKKKQRNLTAPELTAQFLEAAKSIPPPLDTLREGDARDYATKETEERGEEKEAKKLGVRGLFGGKYSPNKEKAISVTLFTAQESKEPLSAKKSPRIKKRKGSKGGSERSEGRSTESPSSLEDASLSQRSQSRLSDDHMAGAELTPRSTGKPESLTDNTNLSQNSGKLSQSQSGHFNLTEECYSTQSSSDFNTQTSLPDHHVLREARVGLEEGREEERREEEREEEREMEREEEKEEEERELEEGSLSGCQFLTNGHLSEELGMEESREVEEEKDFRKGCQTLYFDFGDKQHRLNLRKVRELLESTGEKEPVDMRALDDWDGWNLATKEIV